MSAAVSELHFRVSDVLFPEAVGFVTLSVPALTVVVTVSDFVISTVDKLVVGGWTVVVLVCVMVLVCVVSINDITVLVTGTLSDIVDSIVENTVVVDVDRPQSS